MSNNINIENKNNYLSNLHADISKSFIEDKEKDLTKSSILNNTNEHINPDMKLKNVKIKKSTNNKNFENKISELNDRIYYLECELKLNKKEIESLKEENENILYEKEKIKFLKSKITYQHSKFSFLKRKW